MRFGCAVVVVVFVVVVVVVVVLPVGLDVGVQVVVRPLRLVLCCFRCVLVAWL